jgi:hypothetical protein
LTLTFEHLSDVFISLDDGLVSPTSQLRFNNTWFLGGQPTTEFVQQAEALDVAITGHADADRIKLSLSWLDEAKRGLPPALDVFLKLWFAIETLAMEGARTSGR